MNTKAWIDPGVLILASLAGGPKHGYAIMRDVEDETGVALGPGTLYGALARLEAKGHVAALDGEDRRRPYEITAVGGTYLKERLNHLGSLTRMGLVRLEGMGI